MPDFFRSRSHQADGGESAAREVRRLETDDHEATTAPASPQLDDAGRVGEHIASIVAAAESAAATIRADAEREAEALRAAARRTLDEADTEAAAVRSQAEEYAAAGKRGADDRAAQILADAERRAATIADDAVERDRKLLANIAASEGRLRDLAKSLRMVASSLDDVVGDGEAGHAADRHAEEGQTRTAAADTERDLSRARSARS
jgi:hypothetical protein